MATLPAIVPSRATKQVTPRILRADLGDGYFQRAADGLNTLGRTYQVEWRGYDQADIDTLEAFFEGTEGVDNFDWTPPQGAAGKFVATTWSRDPGVFEVSTLSATFREVFDL